MPYQTILVQLDNGERCAARVTFAAELAAAFHAHLVGLHTAPPPDVPPIVEGVVGDSLLRAREAALERLRARAVVQFDAQIAALAGASAARAEFRAAGDHPVDAMLRQGRYADLLVVGQSERPQPDGVITPHDFPERVILGAGRPVLVVPVVGRDRFVLGSVLIAWDAGRSTLRAITDALPLLERAARVTLLSINPISRGGHGELPGADMALYLARHGVTVEVASVGSIDDDAGATILKHAVEFDSDLVVMGGYGHSRWLELARGGATRTVLEQMRLPVLFSH